MGEIAHLTDPIYQYSMTERRSVIELMWSDAPFRMLNVANGEKQTSSTPSIHLGSCNRGAVEAIGPLQPLLLSQPRVESEHTSKSLILIGVLGSVAPFIHLGALRVPSIAPPEWMA